ncbi:MAG: SCO family protein [Bacteroidetes bacterium]|nr:SCO family protein [Bacteroidota bacterium]
MMSSQLTRVQQTFDNDSSFKILSYSLDPENDSIPVLQDFALKFKANKNTWYLMTGNKKEIYSLGEQGYMQSVLNDEKSIVNHSQKFILVDQDRMIRGFYNGLDSAEVDLMIQDIRYLLYKSSVRL